MYQLVFECAVGIAVLVRCFVDRKATENDIVNRLGDGFSRPPFAAVVVCRYTFCSHTWRHTPIAIFFYIRFCAYRVCC